MANPKPPTSAKDWYGLSLGLPIVIMATRGSDPHYFCKIVVHPISNFIQGISSSNEISSKFTSKFMQFDRFVYCFSGPWKEPPLKNEHSRKSGRCHQPRKTSPRMSSLLWPLFDVWRLSLRLTPVDRGQGSWLMMP